MENKKILVVENDKGTRDVLRRLLEIKKIKVTTFSNPNEAINFLKTAKTDLILAGNCFPNSMDGIEFGLKARGMNIPFVLFSDSQNIVEKARDKGITSFQKPYIKSLVYFVVDLLKEG